MMEVTGNVPCKHFEARVFAKSHCQNCSEVQEAHCDSSTYLEPGRLLGTKTPYCDLQQGPHHPKDTLCILTPSCELVVATGSEQTPESLSVPVDCPSADSSAAQPGGQEIGSGVPYLESLTSPQLRNSSEFSQASRATASISPDHSPGTHCPDDTSTPDTEDLDAVNWTDKPWCSEGLIMMFARHQERVQPDSPQRAPSSVSRPSATGDTLGPRREDSSHGNQSSRESRSKSRGERGYFSLEKNKLDSAQVSQSLQSGLRSISRNPAKTTYHDIPQASSLQRSTQQDTTRASSPHRSTQRDTTRSSSPHRSTQRDTTRSSSPHRSTQRDTTRCSSPHRSTQRDTTRSSSPHRSTQRDTTRSSSPHRSTQRDTTRSSSPHRSTQRDTTRSSSPHRSTQRDTTRSSSPHRSTQRDTTRSSSPHRSTQRDTTRSSSPHRSTQRDTTRSSSPHRSTQRDTTRSSSPHRSMQRDTTRSSSPHQSTQRDTTRSSSPHQSTQRDTTRFSSPHRSTQRDTTRSSSPHGSTQRDTTRSSSTHRSTQQDTTRSSSPHRSTQRDTTRCSSPHRSTQRDTTRSSSPHQSTQWDTAQTSSLHRSTQQDTTRSSSPHRSTQRDTAQASSPHRSSTQRDTIQQSSTQRDNTRSSSTQRDNLQASSPAWSTPKENPRASSSQWDNLRVSSTQRDNPSTSSPARSIQRDNLQASSSHQDNPRTCSTQRDNPRVSCPAWTTPKDNPRSSSIQRDNPGSSSPTRSSQRSNPRTSSPHRTNRDIPWASFPLRPVQSDGPRASSPARPKQSEVPWASFPLRPVQGDSSRTSSPTRSSQLSLKTSQRDSPTRGSSCHSGPRSSTPPLSSTRTSQASSLSRSTSLDSPNPPSVVCIGHRDAPRASSPPRFSQHDPFSFFPEPHDDESLSPHHEAPYIPPAVCIGHRDAPRASSPPRHSQHDPFPFLPNTSDTAESQSPQHDPPQMPPPVCIGHRDAPRASSPPRQSQQEPSLLYQEPLGASSESLAPSTSSVHDPPHVPPPVCIGHRDAPPFSSPPRHVQHDPSFLYQDPPVASSESLALSMDSQHDPPQMPPPVCIGHRDAPLFTSPPRQAYNDPSLLNQNPPGASSESLTPSMDSLHNPLQPTLHVCIGHRDAPRASSPPRHWDSPGVARHSSPQSGPSASKGSGNGEGRRNMEREEYTVLADLPPPKRLNQKEAMGKQNGSASDHTRSPGRTEVERIFGYERRKSEALETYQALEAGRSQRGGGRASGQLQRRQSSPALGREVTKKPPQPSEQARRGRAEPPHTKSSERRPEGDRRSKGGSAPPKNLVKLPERECRARGQLVHSKSLDIPSENDRLGQRQSVGLRHLGKSMEEEWGPPEETSHPRAPKRHLERACGCQGQAYSDRGMERDFRGQEGHSCTRALDMYPDSEWRGPTKEIVGCWRALAEQVCCRRLERLRQSGQLLDWDGPGRSEWDCGLRELSPPPVPERPAKVSWGSLGELPHSQRLERVDEIDWGSLGESALPQRPERPLDMDWRDLGELPHPHGPERPVGTDWGSLRELLLPRSPDSCREIGWGARGEPMFTEGSWLENGEARSPKRTEEAPEREWQSTSEPAGLVIHDKQADVNGYSLGERLLSPVPSVEENGADLGQPIGSVQWPKTKLESCPNTSEGAGLQEEEDKIANNVGPHPSEEPESDGGTLPEPEHPEAAKDQEMCLMTDQEKAATADNIQAKGKAVSPPKGRLVTSWRMPGDQPTLFNPFLISLGVLKWRRPDLLNFKKGWMSILDEPGEWKKHWFVLTDSSLKYYRDSNAEEADELDGEIDLRSCTDVTEFAVQRNYGFQIHTKDAVFTLSAMTSGIRRNWIEALRKTVRPANAPDVTKYVSRLSDSNKENTIHGYSSQKGSLKSEEQRPASDVIGRGTNRKVDGQRQSFDYVELSPLTQGSPQRRVGSVRGSERGAKQDELERDLAQRSEERRKWFEATDGRAGETSAGEGPRKVLGGPLTEDQQSRLSDEIEKKWLELEKLPLRENKRVPLTALLMQSKGEQKGPSGDVTEALEKEVQSLRAQLESCRLRGEGSQDTPKPHDDGHIPRGYISQEACERSLAEMESSHQQVMEELQRHHQRELERLQQEKEWLLAEETAATASAIEAMKKAFKEELNKELGKTRSLQQGPESLRKQHQSDVDSLKRELQVLSEQYSQKCLEIGDLTRQAEEREHVLRHCQQEGRGLLRQNQELHSRLSEEIGRLRSFIASQASSEGLGHNNERSSCELEMLLRVKENELQYLKKEVQCLRNELQMIQKDKRFASGKYQDVYVELNHIKSRSEREIEQLKEHLRLAMAALREKESMRNNLDN